MKVTITLEDVGEVGIEAAINFGNPVENGTFLKSEATQSQRMGIVLMGMLRLAEATGNIDGLDKLVNMLTSVNISSEEAALN